MPALGKILVVFALILFLNRKGVPLFVALFAGAFAIGLWMGLGPWEVTAMVVGEMASPGALWLVFIITAILVLSNLMEQTGHLHRIVETFNRLSPSRRFTALAMPALIGLLPMPGGALFSAPMVEESYPGGGAPELKTALNYWFRHLWEYWWPLYPGVILAVSLLEVETWRFVVMQLPMTLGAIIGGAVFIAKGVPRGEGGGISLRVLGRFLTEMSPILLVLVFLFGMRAITPLLGYHPPKHLGFALGLVVAIGWVGVKYRLGVRGWRRGIFRGSIPRMALIVAGIMAFKGVLTASSAMEALREELTLYGVPPMVVITLLPFISGFVTGIALGFVGASFPLVVSLVPPGEGLLAYGVLAYGFGYMGMMLSPIHLCLLVTKDYFRADLLGSYRYLWKAAFFVVGWTLMLFSLYRWWLA